MKLSNKIQQFYDRFPIHIWGFVGIFFILFGSLISGILFKTEVGQKYSIFQFFISELGGANILILGGLFLTIFMLGLSIQIKSKWGYLFGGIAIFSSINCILVGVYPWDIDLQNHTIVAYNFFYGGMISVFLYSLFFFFSREKIFPKQLGYLGFIVAAIFAAFLFLPLVCFTMDARGFREGISWIAFLEWAILFSITLWIGVISLQSQKIEDLKK